MTMDSSCSDGGSLRRVAPFRYPRITGYLLLPVAFRSLSRLSSALSAKAFSLCSLSLDLLEALNLSAALRLGDDFCGGKEKSCRNSRRYFKRFRRIRRGNQPQLEGCVTGQRFH